MQRYNPKTIEPKWQKIWEETELYKTPADPGQSKYYCLVMFPYPSGNLHVGHWYNFGPADAVARFHRMLGKDVLHPIGFDSFGLPAENAAIKRDIPPAKWTTQNIATMTEQMKAIGTMYDLDKVIATSDPDYYRWTQWLFLKLYESGLAYKKMGVVNWCTVDQTVLANEQVVGDNNECERCGGLVIQKELEQWYFKITDYAERLLEDAKELDWPERVMTMQENWIGRSLGAEVEFEVVDHKDKLKVFTTRPDTIFGATFMVLAPEHPLVSQITTDKQKQSVEEYVAKVAKKTELDRKQDEKTKTGVFTGAYAVNPATKQQIPIWIGDFVLMSYGHGAIMAVPGHDTRDNEFAKKFDLPITFVVEPTFGEPVGDETFKQSVYIALRDKKAGKVLVLNWGPRQARHGGNMLIGGGLEGGEDPIEAAKREIAEETGYTNVEFVGKSPFEGRSYFYSNVKEKNMLKSGPGMLFDLVDHTQIETNMDEGEKDKFVVEWHSYDVIANMLHDGIHKAMYEYLILDQVYSGEGKMINSGKYDGMSSSEAREKIVADLAKSKVAKEHKTYKLRDWLISRQRYWGAPIPIIYCTDCGTVPVPYDQLPVKLPEDVAFTPTGQSPLQTDENFVNTTCPKCKKPAKRETDTMDTFVDSSWYFLRYPNTKYSDGPFDPGAVKKWMPVDHYIGGIEHAILHLLYARFITKALHDHADLPFTEPFKKLNNQGIILGPDGQKMSKSKGNVVDPDAQVASYGADPLRLYLMFMGPYDQGGPYDLGGIAGTRRFLERIWDIVESYLSDDRNEPQPDKDEIATKLAIITQKTVKKVTGDLQKLAFNTAIAAMMSLVNDMNSLRKDVSFAANREEWKQSIETLVRLLAPLAPHISEELWAELGNSGSVHLEAWPSWDEALIKDDLVTIIVQVNGKVRGTLLMDPEATEAEVVDAAKKDDNLKSHLVKGEIKKTIFVKGRLVNFVV